MMCCMRTCLNGNLGAQMYSSSQPQIHLDAAFMGPEVILLSNHLRITGTGGAIATAPLVQSKSYFEVKIQQTGAWSVGVATRQTDLSKKVGGTDDEFWCFSSDPSKFNECDVVTKQPQTNGHADVGLIDLDDEATENILLTSDLSVGSERHPIAEVGDIIGVTFDHIELNFYYNGKNIEAPLDNVKGTVYPAIFVGHGAVLDVIFENFTYGPPAGFEKIMIEQSLL